MTKVRRFPLRVAVILVVALLSGAIAWRLVGDDAVSSVGWREAACRLPHRWVVLSDRGWYRSEVGAHDLIVFRDPPANHSGPQEVLQSIPLAFYGPGLIEPGEVRLDREVTLADVAPTTAGMIGLEDGRWPDGSTIEQALPPGGHRPSLVVTVVMDGGGLNTLAQWPDEHPNVDRILEGGATVAGAQVGTSPSVTTSVHATLSTGAFPDQHAITGLFQRDDQGKIVPAFSLREFSRSDRVTPDNLLLPTVGDLWDVQTNNAARVGYIASFNYPLGMLGHGAAHEGGDRDIAAIGIGRRWSTADDYYSLPSYVRKMRGIDELIDELDRSDGAADDKWMGSEQAFTRLDALPIYPPWQNRALLEMLDRESFGRDDIADLMYVNYKPMDMTAHFWSIDAPQMREAMKSVDAAVGELTDWLEANLAGRYVLILTADHGGIPLRTDSFPYDAEVIEASAERALDASGDEVGIFEELTPTVYFLNRDALEANDLTAEQVADHLMGYTVGDGRPPGREISPEFDGKLSDRLFDAVVPASRLDEVLRCTRGNT